MSSLETDLYLNQMNLRRYCSRGAVATQDECLLKSDEDRVCLDDCPLLDRKQREAFRIALEAREYLNSTPPVTVPRPIDPGLIPMNDPQENDPVLVSANNSLTFEVLVTIWAQGITPAYFLLVDCLGNTVDMAMVFGEFKPEQLKIALEKSHLKNRVAHRNLIIPGLTASLREDFKEVTGWQVEVGPICAAELPLFLGDRWICS